MANTEFSVEDPIDFNPQVGQSVLAQQSVVPSLHSTIELTGSGDIRRTEPFLVSKLYVTLHVVTNPSIIYYRTILTKKNKFII
jgi:hypothetical protein